MYVGRPAFYRFGYELVDVADYGGLFLGDSRLVAGRERVGGGTRGGKLAVEHVAVGVDAEVVVYGFAYFLGAGEPEVYRHIQNVADVVHGVHIHRVGYGEFELPAGSGNREYVVLPENVLRKEFQNLLVHADVLQGNERYIELLRKLVGNVLVLAVSLFDEEVYQFGVYVRWGHSFRNQLFSSKLYYVRGYQTFVLNKLQNEIVGGSHFLISVGKYAF